MRADTSDGLPSGKADDQEQRLVAAYQANNELRRSLAEHASVVQTLKAEFEKLVAYAQSQDDAIKTLTSRLDESQAIIDRFNEFVRGLTYNADGIATTAKTTDFLTDERFVRAYRRGMRSGHRINHLTDPENDLHIEWRVAIALWAAKHAAHLPGAFVECGTYTGILSLAICDYLDFNSLDKDFYLFDTFEGVPLEQVGPDEDPAFKEQVNKAWYTGIYEIAARNFAPFPRVRLVQGIVPDSFAGVEIDQVAYLSIDMNIAFPERAALEHFWPRLVPGGIVVFDDYGFQGHEPQKATHDEFARSVDVEIFTLPTGQGLLIKP